MSTAFRVTSSALRRKADELRNLNHQFKASVSNLQASESALNGMWEGDARKAFHTAFMQNKSKFDSFSTGMEEYAQRLLDAAAEYDNTETKNVGIASTQ